jgi:hypothetical protein
MPGVVLPVEENMNDTQQNDGIQDSRSDDAASRARTMAEQGLHEQARGNIAEADRLLSQALALHPGAVDAVLRQHDAGRAPDARDQATSNRDVERTPPRP